VNAEQSTTDVGYTCAICGAWVPYGIAHHHSYPTPQPSVKWDRMSDVRIADALERIATALEKQAARNDGEDAQATRERGS
jgi:hypothetical protein